MHNTFLCIALVLAFGCVSCVSSLKGTGVCSFLQRFLSFIYNYCDTVCVLFYSQYYCTYLANTSPYIFIITYPQMEFFIGAAASPQLLCVILISLLKQCLLSLVSSVEQNLINLNALSSAFWCSFRDEMKFNSHFLD